MATERDLPISYLPKRWGYVDYFCDANENREPIILDDGTSVVFPKGWTDEDADKWRKGKELQPPPSNDENDCGVFH